ncbi:hypothetical protein PSH79_10690 [Pseudomonas sp. FP2196]|uniref:hypothetical protein n=1 Tax=Pseudomonas sp. FP2196 TaxID=2954086 RepID=UPI002733842E|nr:hypothetical protein [Pseudomonas sp. FP2196]WLH37739.1 hypothetical protein PSH79_10690 [Pseudomonas sp. FP2196]
MNNVSRFLTAVAFAFAGVAAHANAAVEQHSCNNGSCFQLTPMAKKASDALIAADGSSRTPQGQMVAADGSSRTPQGQMVAADGSSRTPQGQMVAENGASRTPQGQWLESQNA